MTEHLEWLTLRLMATGGPVPTATSPFVGRRAELAAVGDLLAAHRLVSLVGPGGSGKTRLALEAIDRLPPVVGVVGVVELGTRPAGHEVADAVLSDLGIREDPALSAVARLTSRLAGAEGLLLLDACEHARVDAATTVAVLLRACPALRIVTTGRVVLGIAGEAVREVGGLADDDAVALFLARARDVHPAPVDDRDAARAVCRSVDRLPLAVELTASHARGLSPAAIHAGTADRLGFPASAGSVAGRPPRRGSVAASISRSLSLVGAPARSALACLSVVEGRFTLDVALAVIGPEPGGWRLLETLVDHSLVRFDPADGRYLLLDTVRDRAGAELVAGQGVERVHDRLARWLGGRAATARAGVERADPEVLASLDADEAAVHVVLGRARSGRLATAAAIVADLAFWWSQRGRCARGRAEAERVVAAHAADGSVVPPRLGWAHAFLAVCSGDLEAGVGRAVGVAGDAGADPATRARALTLVGLVRTLADPAGAAAVLTDAANLAREAGDDRCLVEATQLLACTELRRTRADDALAHADAVRDVVARIGHAQLAAWDDAVRAEAAHQRGDLRAAARLGADGVARAVSVGEPVSGGGALLPLVRALCRGGRSDTAAERVDEFATFVDEHPGLGSAEVVALARLVVGAWCGTRDPSDEPAALARTAAAAGRGVAAEAFALLAALRLGEKDLDGADTAAAAAIEAADAVGDRGTGWSGRLVRAGVQHLRGQDAAEAWTVLAAAHDAGLRPVVVDALDVVAVLAHAAGRTTVAARLHAAAALAREEQGAVPAPLVRALGVVPAPPADPVESPMALGPAVDYARRARGPRRRPRAGWASLTPTEQDVVELTAQGLGNQAIADRLRIGVGTVRTHLRSVFAKLDVTSRAELAARAARRGL